MLSGYYTIASGLLTRQREIDVIGNNMINAQTPGFSAERMTITSFQQQLMSRLEAEGNRGLGTTAGDVAVIVDDTVSLNGSGNLKATDRALDVAINGMGFFHVQSENGQTYLTRNGGFSMDAAGYLSLPGIGRVIGAAGPIYLGSVVDIRFDRDGSIYRGDGSYAGRLMVTVPETTDNLIKRENGMYQLTEGANNTAADYTIAQNYLELSNVDLNRELTVLMEAQRAYQSCSSALQTVDGMNRKAATQIGSI